MEQLRFGPQGPFKEARKIEFPSDRGWNPRNGHYMAFCIFKGHRWKFDHESVKTAPSYNAIALVPIANRIMPSV
jgi:hypothetical protein